MTGFAEHSQFDANLQVSSERVKQRAAVASAGLNRWNSRPLSACAELTRSKRGIDLASDRHDGAGKRFDVAGPGAEVHDACTKRVFAGYHGVRDERPAAALNHVEQVLVGTAR